MFNITSQERRVVIFLISVALAATGMDFLIKRNSRLRIVAYLNQAADTGRIDLNRADRDVLKTIPGVGERLAERIIEYRLRSGGFRNIDQLREINGIGKAKYNTIREYVGVE